MATNESRYRIDGMGTAPLAVRKLRLRSGGSAGVDDVKVSVSGGTMTVDHRDDAGLAAAIVSQVKSLGYGIETRPGSVGGARPKYVWWTSAKGRLTITYGVVLGAAWAAAWLFPKFEWWIFSAAMLVGLIPIAGRALLAARAGTRFQSRC